MASKRTVKRRRLDERPEVKRLRKLLQRAQNEVAELLKRTRTGTITRAQLQMELKEVDKGLDMIGFHFYKI